MKFTRVYQFKISLEGIKPQIWRRIQVPENYTFWDFHVAIQDSMGWWDYHLHLFTMPDPEINDEIRIGIPDDEWEDEYDVVAGWEYYIRDYFSASNSVAMYEYDFGDSWHHRIRLEKILPREHGVKYPICIAGKRTCPPEDCGGVWGFQEFLKAIKNSRHEDHESMLEWVGGSYDPMKFDPGAVKFDNPRKRWRTAFES